MIQNIKYVEDLRERILNTLKGDHRAPYIVQHAETITNRVMSLVNENSEFLELMNHNSVDALKITKRDIGQNWIRKISSVINIQSMPNYFGIDEIKTIKKRINIKIETSKIAVLKENADLEEAYKLFEKLQEEMPEESRIIVTYKQLHNMFGGVKEPYSENFKMYFKKHRKEFLTNPRYISFFSVICNNFETIINSAELKNKYEKDHLELDDILGYLGSRKYGNQRPVDEKLAYYASSVGKIVTEEQFEDVQKVFDIVRKRERTSIPPIYVKRKKYRGRMLSPNDILAMFVGNITDCCQVFGDNGMGAMLLGAIEENCGIFVIEEFDEKGDPIIIGQSLVIRQKGKDGNNSRLTFDNIEIAENIGGKLTDEESKEILSIYEEAGKQAIKLDVRFLNELVKNKKISQEIRDEIVIKEVIVGRGWNDLKGLDKLPDAETIVPEEHKYYYRTKAFGKEYPFIDSTESGARLGSNKYKPAQLTEMEKSELKKIKQRSSVEPTKLDEVPLWYGKTDGVKEFSGTTITEEIISLLKQIENKVYRKGQQEMNNNRISTTKEFEECFGFEEKTKVIIGSEEKWYIIYGENKKDIIEIADIALEGGLKTAENTKEKEFSLLSVFEMTNELYRIMIKAQQEKRRIICNATKDTSLRNIKNLIRKRLAEVYDKNGRKIVLKGKDELIYENDEEVEYRNFKGTEDIQMLDIEIRPNYKEIVEEKMKIENLLERVKVNLRLKGREKEKGLDEERRNLRDEL